MKNNYSFEFPVTEKKMWSWLAEVLQALWLRWPQEERVPNTLLIERASYLGGMMTGGLVNSLHGYRLHKDYVKAAAHEQLGYPPCRQRHFA